MFLSYTVDTLSAIYLICLGLGLVMSIGSLILGGHTHDASGNADVHLQGTDNPQGLQDSHGFDNSQTEAHVPFLSMNTILAFSLGFGAGGFASQQLFFSSLGFMSLTVAIPVGLIFSSSVYLVLSKILIRGQSAYMKESDFDLRGIEGTVSSSLYPNHLGEVSYILRQSVQAIPARDKSNRTLPKGTIVVILSIHQGVATVLPLDEFKQHIAQKED